MTMPRIVGKSDVDIALGQHLLRPDDLLHAPQVKVPIEYAPVKPREQLRLLPMGLEHMEVLQEVEEAPVLGIKEVVDDLIRVPEELEHPPADLTGYSFADVAFLHQGPPDQLEPR